MDVWDRQGHSQRGRQVSCHKSARVVLLFIFPLWFCATIVSVDQRKICKPAEPSLIRKGLFCAWLHLHIHLHVARCHLPTHLVPAPLQRAPVRIWWLKCKGVHSLGDSCRPSPKMMPKEKACKVSEESLTIILFFSK